MTQGNATREKVERLQGQLAEMVGELTTGEEWRRYLDVAAKFHRYSPNNTLLEMEEAQAA